MYSKIFILFVLYSVRIGYAQNSATIVLSEQALYYGGALYGHASTTFQYYAGNTGTGSNNIQFRTNVANFSAINSTATIPVGSITLKRIWDDQVVLKAPLSQTNQFIYTSTGTYGESVTFNIDFGSDNIQNYAWPAGEYSTSVFYTTSGSSWNRWISPTQTNLTLQVPRILSPMNSNSPDIVIPIDFGLYPTGFIYMTGAAPHILHTVLGKESVTAATSLFQFSNGLSDPSTPANVVQYQMSSPSIVAMPVYISTTPQPIARIVSIPVGNKSPRAYRIDVSSANLIAHFKNKGDYTLALESTLVDDNGGLGPSVTTSVSHRNLIIKVPDMGAFTVSTPTVGLNFNTAADYSQGVSNTVVNHISVSKTTPYVITARANSPHFSNGTHTLPVSIMQLGPAAGESEVNVITLSDQAQPLISSTLAQLNKSYSVRYHIMAAQSQHLVNASAGTYSAVITYTLTAL